MQKFKEFWKKEAGFFGILLGVALLVTLVAFPPRPTVVYAAQVSEQVKTFVYASSSVYTSQVEVDKQVNEWLAENPTVIIRDRKVSSAAASMAGLFIQSYTVTIFYRPAPK